MVDAIMFESVYYYKQWSIINNHNVLNCSKDVRKRVVVSDFFLFILFFFTDFPFLSLNSSLLSTMIISRRIPLSFVAAAAAVAAAALALELQKKIHLVASSQE